MRRQTREPIDWDVALSLHDDHGWSYAEIAREYGYAYKTVRDALMKRGTPPRRAAGSGLKAQKLRDVWRFMHDSCERTSHPSFKLNGAKGVRVDPEWQEFETFYRWALASGYRVGLRLMRNDLRRPYGPKNCRWVTAEQRVLLRKWPHRTKPAKKPRPINWEGATRLYLDEGLSQPEVAKRVGCSYTGIVAGFKRLGVTRPREPGLTNTPEGRRLYKTWFSLHRRCADERHQLYRYYGARGIRVCKEWKEFKPFFTWAQQTGARPGLCLIQTNRQKDYDPKNCEWVTKKEMIPMRRPPSHAPTPRRPLTAFGETKSMAAWTRDPRCSVSAPTIAQRLDHGSSPQQAISDPPTNTGKANYPVRKIKAFGQTKGISQWATDHRCKVTVTGLADRLRRGWTPEVAMTTPPFKQPRARR